MLFDSMPPVASLDLNQPPPAGFGDPGIVFNVTFFDDVAVSGSSLGDDDFRVMGPNGYNQLAHYIPNAPRDERSRGVDVCLSNSFGFGGQNDTLVVRRVR